MMQYIETPLYVYMPIIFFIYAMSFIMLGASAAIEHMNDNGATNRIKIIFSSPMGYLALFGILHGLFEFVCMFSILNEGLLLPLKLIRLLLLSTSFFFLCKYGASYGIEAAGHENGNLGRPSWFSLANVLCSVWFFLCLIFFVGKGFSDEWFTFSEIFSRYFIGVPGAFLASFALWSSGKGQKPGSKKYWVAASMSFAMYALGGLIVPRADFFPASWLNDETFYGWAHIPITVFRTLCAVAAAVSVLKVFRLSRDFVGIRFKAIWHVVIGVAMPTFCIILLVCYVVGNALLRFSYKDHQKYAIMAAGEVYNIVDDIAQSVQDSLVFSRNIPAMAKRDIYTSVVRGNVVIRGIAFIDEKGEIGRIRKYSPLSSAVRYEGATDGARMNRFLEGFEIDMSENNFSLSGYDKDNLIIAIPSPKGRVEVLLDLEKIYREGTASVLEKGWHILLLDPKGESVYPADWPPPEKEEVRAHPASAAGIFSRKTVESGIYYNVVEAKILSTGWSVIIEIPRREIVVPIFGVLKALLIGVLAVNLFSVVVSVILVGRVTKPINLIAGRVKSIGREDFAPRVNVSTNDELQTLSEEVEKMAVLLSEKKRMEKQISQTQKLASLGRLVAGVAHEINNPLGIILGYSQLLQRESEPQSRIYLDLKIVERHTLACKKIVEDLLKFSRADRQRNVEVDVTTSIRETLSLVEKHFSKGNVTITLEADPKLFKVKGDPDKLRQLFLNLALNALDAMKKGGTLTVGVSHLESDEVKGVEITFKDTGPGISQKDIERVFEPFFTTKEVGKGTGLGLSVSYGIVTDHGGRIWVESEVGKGAIFHVMLPAAKIAEEL